MTVSSGRIDEAEVDELARRLPDVDARERVLELLHPLTARVASRFSGRGEALDDLAQIAAVGMLRAVDQFDPQRGDSLVAYTLACMFGELRHHFRDRSRLVRMPRDVAGRAAEVSKAVDTLTQRLGRSPTVREIATDIDMSPDRVLEALNAARVSSPSSIDDVEVDVTEAASEDEFAFLTDWMTVAPALERLPRLQRRVLYLRFHRGMSQSSVAGEIGVSQVQVSRLLSKALVSLRRLTAP